MLYSLISQHSTFNLWDNSHNSRDKLLHISFFFRTFALLLSPPL